MEGAGKKLDNLVESGVKLSQGLKDLVNDHRCYKYYSYLGRIERILDDGSLVLTNGDRWNDKVDKRSFNSDSYPFVRFGICLTFSRSENVAMWAIYGKKRDGAPGAMINFSRNQLREIVQSVGEIELLNFSGSDLVSLGFLRKDSFDIYLQDVLYVDEKETGKVTIKRSDERKAVDSHLLEDDEDLITKSYPWFFENECRLIVKIDRNCLKTSDIVEAVRVQIPKSLIDPLAKKVVLAPGASVDPGKVYSLSSLHGKIDWG